MLAIVRKLFTKKRPTRIPPSLRIEVGPEDYEEEKPDPRAAHLAAADPTQDALGVTTIIEYVDARGQFSRRRVTIHRFTQGVAGSTILQCDCHECEVPRSFRLDRIRTCVTLDGEFVEPIVFFDEHLGVQVDPGAFGQPDREPSRAPRPERPATPQQRLCRDEIRLLAAVSHSDVSMHSAEIDVIISFVESRCIEADQPIGDDDRAALARCLPSQGPDAATVEAIRD